MGNFSGTGIFEYNLLVTIFAQFGFGDNFVGSQMVNFFDDGFAVKKTFGSSTVEIDGIFFFRKRHIGVVESP